MLPFPALYKNVYRGEFFCGTSSFPTMGSLPYEPILRQASWRAAFSYSCAHVRANLIFFCSAAVHLPPHQKRQASWRATFLFLRAPSRQPYFFCSAAVHLPQLGEQGPALFLPVDLLFVFHLNAGDTRTGSAVDCPEGQTILNPPAGLPKLSDRLPVFKPAIWAIRPLPRSSFQSLF